MKAAKITVGGVSYSLVLDGEGMFQIRDDFGSTKLLLEAIEPDTREAFEAACSAAALLSERGELIRRRLGYEPGKIPERDDFLLLVRPFEVVDLKNAVIKASALANVNKTHDELLAGRFRSKGFYEFDLVERGKPRHIRSVHISERVVQRCLCDYSLVPMLSRTFIYDNGASLRGKGYDFAVRRVSGFLTKHYRQYGREGYALVFDFSKYFDTAQHGPVFREIEKSGLDDRLVSISEYFIKCFGDVGLGLGSQVSQIAAIALPNRIDHYVKDKLGIKAYERYMDDGLAVHRSKKVLQKCLAGIKRICTELGIKINEKKTQIIKLSRGFTFLKVRFRYGKNGAIIRRACYKSIKHMRDKLKVFRRWVDSGRMAEEDAKTSLTSWRGHMKKFRDYFAVQTVEREYRELFAA